MQTALDDKETQVLLWLLLIIDKKIQPVLGRNKGYFSLFSAQGHCVLAKAKLCQLTANTHPSSADKLDTSHESNCGLEEECNKSTKHKWRFWAPVRGLFFTDCLND